MIQIPKHLRPFREDVLLAVYEGWTGLYVYSDNSGPDLVCGKPPRGAKPRKKGLGALIETKKLPRYRANEAATLRVVRKLKRSIHFGVFGGNLPRKRGVGVAMLPWVIWDHGEHVMLLTVKQKAIAAAKTIQQMELVKTIPVKTYPVRR